MEFLSENLVNTSTMLSTDGGNTSTLSYILDPDPFLQWRGSGNVLGTNSTIQITFSSATTFDTIIFCAPMRAFSIYRDGVTASTLSFQGGATTTTDYNSSGNTADKYFFKLSQTYTATTLHLQLTKVLSTNAEKAVGYIYVGNSLLTFEKDPDASGFIPMIDAHQFAHQMSDGGVRLHTVRYNKSADLKLKTISQAFRDDLKTIYDSYSKFTFVPFGTGTGWDGFFINCVWEGDFDFYKFSDNAVSAGYRGSIKLREAGK